MKKLFLILSLFILTRSLFPFSSQQFYNLGNFKLQSGKVIENCFIGFRTIGKLNETKSNIIVYPTWFGGTSENIQNLIVKRNFIDTTNYFIVIIDALGNGISSSPSNSQTQKNEKFPQFTLVDMVNTEYEFITNHLKVKKVHAIIGGSMGSMQALMFSVLYPDFADRIVGYVFSPKLSSYDLMTMNFSKELIEICTNYNVPEDEIMRFIDILTAIQAKSPKGFYKDKDENDFEKYFSRFNEKKVRTFTKYNYLYQLKAMLQLDIFKNMDTVKFNKIPKLLIYSTSDHILSPKFAEKMSNFENTNLVELDDDCGHMAVDCNFELVRKLINDFLK